MKGYNGETPPFSTQVNFLCLHDYEYKRSMTLITKKVSITKGSHVRPNKPFRFVTSRNISHLSVLGPLRTQG